MRIDTGFMDEIRNRITLSELIGKTVTLKKRGRLYFGLCPFHAEKSPSFMVDDKGQHFHCFGCAAHGDAITYVMHTEGRDFVDTVEILAEQLHLEMPNRCPEERKRFREMQELFQAVETAAKLFSAFLDETPSARAYLSGRSLGDHEITTYRLGYAPPSGTALWEEMRRDFRPNVLVTAGLMRERDGEHLDFFRDRIMFPITDRRGRTVAFGGRVLGDAKPKYLNSPETPIFSKGQVLYGMPAAQAAAAREASAIVTEGYLDVIAMQTMGFPTAVAPLGTALAHDQLEALWKLSDTPVLCFDGDQAGKMAAARAIRTALPTIRAPQGLKFAILPPGQDPDSIIRRSSTAVMRDILDRALTMAEMIWSIETETPADTPEQRAALEKRLFDRISVMQDGTLRAHYAQFFNERLGRRARQPVGGRLRDRPVDAPTALRQRQDRMMLATLVNHPQLVAAKFEELADVSMATKDLDDFRRELMEAHVRLPEASAQALQEWIRNNGSAHTLDAVLSPEILSLAPYASPEASDRAVELAWDSMLHARRAAAIRGKLIGRP